jgi:hypothetical protein
MRFMRAMLIIIGVIQILFGTWLLVAPDGFPAVFHLQPAAPGWVNWILAMSAARFVGYGIGCSSRHGPRGPIGSGSTP